jgi:hypothetical protein
LKNPPVGGCSRPLQLLVGNATLTEVARTGTQLVGINVRPTGRLVDSNVGARTAIVSVVGGDLATQTIVTFTNKTVPVRPPTGLVKICKRAGTRVEAGSTFTLATQQTKSVDVQAEFCSSPRRSRPGT